MSVIALEELVSQHLAAAKEASSGRSAHTLYSGSEHRLRQTLIALAGGQGLDEHESPGDATLQVLQGRVVLRAGDDSWEVATGQLVEIPPRRHALDALEDSVVLLSVAPKH